MNGHPVASFLPRLDCPSHFGQKLTTKDRRAYPLKWGKTQYPDSRKKPSVYQIIHTSMVVYKVLHFGSKHSILIGHNSGKDECTPVDLKLCHGMSNEPVVEGKQISVRIALKMTLAIQSSQILQKTFTPVDSLSHKPSMIQSSKLWRNFEVAHDLNTMLRKYLRNCSCNLSIGEFSISSML